MDLGANAGGAIASNVVVVEAFIVDNNLGNAYPIAPGTYN